jgi:hypothetical protein
MRIYTNKYLTYNTFGKVLKNLNKCESIMIVEKKVYVPLIVKNICPENIIKINHAPYVPNSITNYISKFEYYNLKEYDLVDEYKLKDYKLKFENNLFNILLPKDLKKNEIILVEDNDKFNGVF